MKSLIILLTFFLTTFNSPAIVIYGTGDPCTNTNAPDLSGFENSGWDYMGNWGNYTGTVIAPLFFIAAQHVGGSVGDPFYFQGEVYVTVDTFPDFFSDFQIWEVDRVLPVCAPLYLKDDELGKTVLMIGRGTQRGKETYAECLTEYVTYVTNIVSSRIIYAFNENAGKRAGIRTKYTPNDTFKNFAKYLTPVETNYVYNITSVTNKVISRNLAGWEYGEHDSVKRWGTNIVKSRWDSDIATHFNSNAGFNECSASVGDSSGAAFIKDEDDGVWKLDAIIIGVTSYHLYFDGRGVGGGCDLPEPLPTSTFAQRIDYRIGWINSIIQSK